MSFATPMNKNPSICNGDSGGPFFDASADAVVAVLAQFGATTGGTTNYCNSGGSDFYGAMLTPSFLISTAQENGHAFTVRGGGTPTRPILRFF